MRSTAAHEREVGSKSLDPSWAQLTFGARLTQGDDEWVYRNGMHRLDALQVVALKERIITAESAYSTGEDAWQTVDALHGRRPHIPEYESTDHEAVSTLLLAKLAAINHSLTKHEAPTEQEQRERAEPYRKYRENLWKGTKPGDECAV